jgi:hypothetical protein
VSPHLSCPDVGAAATQCSAPSARDVEVTAAGFGVQAFVTLEMAQGALDEVSSDLEAQRGVRQGRGGAFGDPVTGFGRMRRG